MDTLIRSNIEITFRSKDQMVSCVSWLLKEVVNWHFEVEYLLGEVGETWLVTIHDVCWANNVYRLYDYLKGIDYEGRVQK